MLRKAAQTNDLLLAQACLRRPGLDLEAKDGAGRTALFHAVSNGAVDVVKYLLLVNADPNAYDYQGSGPVDEGEYWLAKNRLGHCGNPDSCGSLEKVLILLASYGGKARKSDLLHPSEQWRRRKMENEAAMRGIALPWLQPYQFALRDADSCSSRACM